MCYGIGLLLCIVALFFPEGNVFRELAIYILLTVSVFNWYKEYKSKKKEFLCLKSEVTDNIR